MGQSMTYKTIVRKHPNRFIVAVVDRRHPDSKRAVLFKVLQTFINVEGLRRALDYYKAEGFKNVVPINSFMEDDKEAPDMPPELTAEFFRNYFNT